MKGTEGTKKLSRQDFHEYCYIDVIGIIVVYVFEWWLSVGLVFVVSLSLESEIKGGFSQNMLWYLV